MAQLASDSRTYLKHNRQWKPVRKKPRLRAGVGGVVVEADVEVGSEELTAEHCLGGGK